MKWLQIQIIDILKKKRKETVHMFLKNKPYIKRPKLSTFSVPNLIVFLFFFRNITIIIKIKIIIIILFGIVIVIISHKKQK